MKTPQILLRLLELSQKHKSVLNYIEEIEAIRADIDDMVVLEWFVNLIREKVQAEAIRACIDYDGFSLVAMATGSGKSRVGVELGKHYCRPYFHLALLVPTEKLRDENWKEEYIKWESELWEDTERLCYASASKGGGRDIDLAILDEGHNITERSAEFFTNNTVKRAVVLTATNPDPDSDKGVLLASLGFKLVYELTLDQAVRLGFVAPYDITIVTVPLEATIKDIETGGKDKKFMTTELKNYEYLTSRVEELKITAFGSKEYKFAILRRMQFIYKLKSKTRAIHFLLDKVIPQDERTLIFAGSIEQANAVCPYRYHSKVTDKAYNQFKAEEINRLSCVKAVNEGHNFPGLDSGIVGQLNSKEKDLVQRIGRLIRFRPGHKAKLYIVVADRTQDMVWLETATRNLNQTKIDTITFDELQKQYS